MPKKKITPEVKADRNRTEDELQLRRAMASLRESHAGLIWSGIKHNLPSGPRVVLELDFATADEILHTLADDAGIAWAPEDFATTTPKAAKTLPESVTELRAMAKAAGVKGYSKMAKPDLITALT